MTKAILQQALEALETAIDYTDNSAWSPSATFECAATITALRAALENDNSAVRDTDIFTLTRPLLVVDELDARAVKIHGNRGEATVRITTMLSVNGAKMNLEKRQQIERWTLKRRDRKNWEVLFPEDAVYVRRDVAVRALAHQLARLSDAEDTSTNLQQKSQLAQMLNAILVDPTLVGQK